MLQLHLGYDFHSIIFQIEHKLYTSRSRHNLSVKTFCAGTSHVMLYP